MHTVRIKDILNQVDRKVLVKPFEEYEILGVRLNGQGVFHRETKEGAKISTTLLNQVKSGDFIYSRLFAWQGAFGIIDKEFDNYYVSNEFPIFTPINGNINIKYLYYFFQLKPILAEVERKCEGSTKQTRNRYKEKFFLNYSIDLPDIKVQNQIVEKLDKIKDEIENIKIEKRGLTKLLDNFLYSLFVDTVKGTNWKSMNEVAPIIRREVTIKQDEEYPELGIRSFGKGTFHKPAIKGINLGTKRIYQIKTGDLIFSNVFAWEGGIAVATENDNDRYGSHRFISCDVNKEKALPEFLCFHHLTPEGMGKIQLASPGGAGRNKTLGLKKLEAIKVPIPPIEKQKKFVDTYYKINRIKQEIGESIKNIEGLFPSALHKALKVG